MRLRPPQRPARPRLEEGDPRFVLLVAELAERLRPVRAEWDEARFQALVQQIARLKVHWGDAYRTEANRGD